MHAFIYLRYVGDTFKVADKDTKTTIIKVESLDRKVQFKCLPKTMKEKQKYSSRTLRRIG